MGNQPPLSPLLYTVGSALSCIRYDCCVIKAPAHTRTERKRGENRKQERRGGRRVQSNQRLPRDHMISQHEFCLRAYNIKTSTLHQIFWRKCEHLPIHIGNFLSIFNVVFKERHYRHWFILRFWAIWLFMRSCFWLVKRKHPKYIFKCFFIKLYLVSVDF